jgi:hypothetical protein
VPTSADAPQGNALQAVEPATLVDYPNNARRPHRDLDSLAPSIGALGILSPPPGFQGACGYRPSEVKQEVADGPESER